MPQWSPVGVTRLHTRRSAIALVIKVPRGMQRKVSRRSNWRPRSVMHLDMGNGGRPGAPLDQMGIMRTEFAAGGFVGKFQMAKPLIASLLDEIQRFRKRSLFFTQLRSPAGPLVRMLEDDAFPRLLDVLMMRRLRCVLGRRRANHAVESRSRGAAARLHTLQLALKFPVDFGQQSLFQPGLQRRNDAALVLR